MLRGAAELQETEKFLFIVLNGAFSQAFYLLYPPFGLSSLVLSLLFRCKFFSLTETPEDYTIIVDEEGFKGGPHFVDLLKSLWQP